MIQLILNILRSQLNDFIVQVGGTVVEPAVVLGNIGLATSLGGSENYMQNTVVISLVNMIEESALKNSSPYRNVNNRVEMTSTPAFMNLFLLFTANFANSQGATNSNDTLYTNGITRLSQVIEFFQNKQVFTIQNSPDGTNFQNPALQDIRISMELYSMTFEQVNHLWGSLGGKQMPFVMYLARVLPVRRDYVTGRGEMIQDVQTDVVGIQK